MVQKPKSKKHKKVTAEGSLPDASEITLTKEENEEGEWQVVEKKGPVKVKSSSFHITINTNQRYGSKDAIIQDMRPLYNTLKTDVFGSVEGVKQVVEIMKPNDTFEDNVGSVNSDIGIEYSPTAGLHAHVLVTIVHTTKVRINLPGLRALLDEKLPHLQGDAPYVNVRFVPDQKGVVHNYVNKMVRGHKLKLREGMEFTEMPSCKCECNIGDMSEFFS